MWVFFWDGHDYYLFMIVLKCSHLVQIHNKTKYKILIVFIYFCYGKRLTFFCVRFFYYYLFLLKERLQDPRFFIFWFFFNILFMAFINFCLILKCSFLILKFSHLLHIHKKSKYKILIVFIYFYYGKRLPVFFVLVFFFLFYFC